MRYLITGRAGSGKSAVTAELARRGYNAFDTDAVHGLSSWRDKTTKKLVSIKDNSFVDLNSYEWVWDPSVLNDLVSKHNDIFVCGGASNDFEFEDLFDKHFVLSVTPNIQIKRLQTRVNNDYGKDPRMFEAIIYGQALHAKKGEEYGAIIIDANLPIQTVVDTILESS